MKKLNIITKSLRMSMLLLFGIAAAAQEQSNFRPSDAENKVAILPITYIGEGNDIKLQQMRYSLQNIAHRYLEEAAIELEIQDPSETNALLLKNGVTEYNYRSFTPKELAGMLEAEFVLIGTVSQETEAVLTVSHSRRMNTRRDDHYHHHHRYRNERSNWSNTRTSQDINTTVDITIYNGKGQQIFSRSRRSLLSRMDTYKSGLQYLLKRTPLYKR